MAVAALMATAPFIFPAAHSAVLRTRLWGLDFPSPIGMAAGFDKNAEAMSALLRLGFGFVETGTVTPRPQAGNAKPRLFRLDEDEAVINRLGFNSQGLAVVQARLAKRSRDSGIVGANVGCNRDSVDEIADYVAGVNALAPLSDMVVVNISSPNTPGLRALQERARLSDLLGAVVGARNAIAGCRTPILVKVAPDLDEIQIRDIAEVALQQCIDGIVATNTTVERPAMLRSAAKHEAGGLSGRPLFARATRVLHEFYSATGGTLPLVGVGGVFSGVDALEKIKAGATLVQLYSGMVYDGPFIARRIARDLALRLAAEGFGSIAEAVGAAHR